MSSFMVGSVRIYGWSELTIPSHRCCLWHWVYHMSGFTTNWFLKLLGYIYIYAIIIIPMIFPRIMIHIYKYKYLNIYIYTHTPKQKQKKTCWTNLHNCCMVVSNHGAQWSNCLCGLHWMQGRIESHCHQSALRDHQRWPLGLSTAPANVQKLRWVCWMIFMGSMAFIPPQNGSGYTVLRCKKKLVTGYNFSYTKSYDKLWSETNINYFFTFL